jgi:hypothetical protein
MKINLDFDKLSVSVLKIIVFHLWHIPQEEGCKRVTKIPFNFSVLTFMVYLYGQCLLIFYPKQFIILRKFKDKKNFSV